MSATKKAGEGFLNATKAYLRKAKEPAISLALDASVAGLMSSIRDLSTEATTGTDLNVLERALDNAKGELIAGGAIATIASTGGAASRKIDKWYKSQATNYLSTLDRTFVENEFKDREQKGLMTADQVKKELEKIDEWNKIRKDNPNVAEEKQPTIYGLILAKKQLTEAFKNADESNKADILQSINKVDNKIQEANSNPDPLAAEVDEDGVKVSEIKTEEVKPTEDIYFNKLHKSEKFDDDASVRTYLGEVKGEKNIFYTLPNKGIIAFKEIKNNTNRFSLTANAKNDTPTDIKNAFKRIEKYPNCSADECERFKIS